MKAILSRVALAAACMLALMTHGWAQTKTPAQILSDISSQIVTNSSGRITATVLASILNEITNSAQFTTSTASANLVYSGPSAGGANFPTFRSLVGADLPIVTTDNIVWGTSAGLSLNGATGNVLIGNSAGTAMVTGTGNVGIGYQPMRSMLSGTSHNIGVGYLPLTALTTGQFNVAVGYQAGTALTTSSGNIFVGEQAGLNYTCTAGAIGSCVASGYSLPNVAIGQFAAKYAAGDGSNVCIGYATCGGNGSGVPAYVTQAASGQASVAVGAVALGAVTLGDENVGIGDHACAQTTIGSQNTCIGRAAGNANISGSNDILIGHAAGFMIRPDTTSTATPGYDIYIGDSAGNIGSVTRTGHHNIGIGNETGPVAACLDCSNTISIGTDTGNVASAGVSASNTGKIGQALTDISFSGRTYSTSKLNTLANAAGQTWTVAQILGNGTVLTRSGAAGVSDTTPTAALIVAAVPGCEVGMGWTFSVINTNSNTLTIVAGAGVTLSGTTTIATVNTRQYSVSITNCTVGAEAATLQGVQIAAN